MFRVDTSNLGSLPLGLKYYILYFLQRCVFMSLALTLTINIERFTAVLIGILLTFSN